MPLVSDNAGSTLTHYELWVDDGLQGEIKAVYSGLNRTVELTTVIGRTYRFQYRVANVLGWSPLSEVVFILAATVPAKPDS